MSFLFKKRPREEVVLGEGAQGRVFEVDQRTVKKVYYKNLGSEYSDIVSDPRRIIAEGEKDAWNNFYSRFMPKYATAKLDKDGSLLLPKLPGIPADKLKTRPKDIDLFKKSVSMTMQEVLGKRMSDQKDSDVLVSTSGSGATQFLQVDFGEFGMYKLLDEVVNNIDSTHKNTPHG